MIAQNAMIASRRSRQAGGHGKQIIKAGRSLERFPVDLTNSFALVMPGLVPRIHVYLATSKTCPRAINRTVQATNCPGAWMAGTSPAMTG
jgi:hypothetical protein